MLIAAAVYILIGCNPHNCGGIKRPLRPRNTSARSTIASDICSCNKHLHSNDHSILLDAWKRKEVKAKKSKPSRSKRQRGELINVVPDRSSQR
jgi:hypothetical protein